MRQRPLRLGDLSGGAAAGQISIEQALIAAGVNPLAPFYINAKPPWPGLDLLLLLGQAKRRGFA